jgi:hypothetical protein
MPENNQSESPDQKSKARALLREWGFDAATFEVRAKKSIENARGDLGEVTGALRHALTMTKQTLLDLHKARQPVAAELKIGFEHAWDEIERAFASARRKMREGREAEAPTAGEKKPTDISSGE